MKRTVTAILLVLFVAGMVFASGEPEGEGSDSLRVMWWGSQNRHERTIETLELYEANNDGLEVTYEFAGWTDYWTKLTTMAAGRNLPDVIQQDYAYLTEWQSRGLIQPLDPFVDSGLFDFSDVADANLAGGRIDGQLYGVNLGVNSQCMVLDVARFEEAGVPLPDDDWTWSEFEEIVLKLHEETGVFGFGAGLLGEQLWKSLYLADGSWAFNDDGTALGYEDDSVFIEYIEMVLRLQEAGAIPHISREASDYANGDNLEMQPIIPGDAAMASMWSNQLTAMWTAAGGPEERDFVMVMLPRLEQGRPGHYIKPSMFFAISRDAQNPDEAARFIDFVTNDLGANQILLAERGVPIADAVRDDLTTRVGRPQEVVFEFMSRVGADSSPIPAPDPVGYTDLIQNVYFPVVRDGVRFGEYTPSEATEILRERAAEILGAAN